MREVGTGEYFDEDGNVVRPFEYKAITTMTTDELAIHRGVEYIIELYKSSLQGNGIYATHFHTPVDKDVRIRFSNITVEGTDILFRLIEAPTSVIGSGNLVTAKNLNRQSSNTSELIIHEDIDSWTNGEVIKLYVVFNDRKTSGNIKTGEGTEILLKRDTDYVLSLENLTSTSASGIFIGNIFREE